MSGVLSGVDGRTQLVGHNRLELLLFSLDTPQMYGVNVFKVREVLSCPELRTMANSHPSVCGVMTMRGQTFSVIDLQFAVGRSKVSNIQDCNVIVTEYNRMTQGFLVSHIHNIVNLNWDQIKPAPKGMGDNHFLTAVTEVDSKLVEILDVEKILEDITGKHSKQLESLNNEAVMEEFKDLIVTVIDDSAVARKQIIRTLESRGVQTLVFENGQEALDGLKGLASKRPEIFKKIALVISDVEMPIMDGYTFVKEARTHDALKDLRIVMHTSLSGVFDSSLVSSVDADGFLSKFDGNELSGNIKGHLLSFLAGEPRHMSADRNI